MAKKDNSVQTLRGFAIILVVMGHVIGYNSNEGMKVADDSFWRHLYHTLEYFRMPLFTVISGWVYTLRPITKENLNKFLNGKIRRLLVPLVAVGLLYFIVRMITPGTNRTVEITDIWKFFVFKYDLYWYLPGLFWVFIVISILEYKKWMKSVKSWLLVLVLSIIVLGLRKVYLVETPNYFGIIGMFYLLPFFIIGLGLGRFQHIMFNKVFITVMTFLFIGGIVIQQMQWYHVIELPFHGKSSPIGLLVGMTGSIVLFRIHLVIGWLIYIGNFSYGIYLFHVFGTAGSRIMLYKVDITNSTIVFFISLSAGIIIPILIEMILVKNKYLKFLFLGKRLSK